MTIADTAYQTLQTMPTELQQQALDFIEFIKQKNQLVNQTQPVIHTQLEDTKTDKRQLGFMAGHGTVPNDINWGDKEIEDMFTNEMARDECYFSDSSGFGMLKTNKSAVAIDIDVAQFAKDDRS